MREKTAPRVSLPLDLSATPVFRILTLASRLTTGFVEVYGSRFGVGLPEWRTLALLGLHGPITAIRIAELAQIDRGAVSRAVASLERRGLLARDSDAADKRRQPLKLTQAGCALHDRIARFAVRRQSWLLSQFTDAEQEQLAQLLAKLARVVGHLMAHPEPPLAARRPAAVARAPRAEVPRGLAAAGPAFERARLLSELDRFRELLLR